MPPPTPREESGRVRWLWVTSAAGIVLLLTGYFLLPLDVFGPKRPELSWTVFTVALVALSAMLLREIRRMLEQRHRGHPTRALLMLICLSLVIFSTAYLALAHNPGEFNGLHTRLDALYFTVITVSTVGFGDIAPAGQAARAVVIVQIGYNFVFLAAAVSALTAQLRGRVAHRVRSHHHRPPGEPGADDSADHRPG